MNVIGMWGTHLIFQVNADRIHTFKDLTVDTTDNCVTHSIYGFAPYTETVGKGLTSFKMTIEVLPESGGAWKPRRIAERLRKYMRYADVAPLIIGTKLMSPFDVRISALSEKWERIDARGNLLKLRADVTFTEAYAGERSIWRQ